MMYEIVRHENQTHDPLISSLDALYSECWRLLGEQGRNLITITPVILITKCYCDEKKKRVKDQGTQKI